MNASPLAIVLADDGPVLDSAASGIRIALPQCGLSDGCMFHSYDTACATE
jgi:hypothetical protein